VSSAIRKSLGTFVSDPTYVSDRIGLPGTARAPGGAIAVVCSRCQSQRNYEFATHRSTARYHMAATWFAT
jgi:hypothetical protein